MIVPAIFGALLVLTVWAWARAIHNAAVSDGLLPTPLPLALRYTRQLRARRLHPWWRRR